MTRYQLEEFKQWLEAEPERKEKTKKIKWSFVFKEYRGEPACWEKTLRGEKGLLFNYYELIQEWKAEVDQRERERERGFWI